MPLSCTSKRAAGLPEDTKICVDAEGGAGFASTSPALHRRQKFCRERLNSLNAGAHMHTHIDACSKHIENKKKKKKKSTHTSCVCQMYKGPLLNLAGDLCASLCLELQALPGHYIYEQYLMYRCPEASPVEGPLVI